MAKFKNLINTPFAENGIRAEVPDTLESSGGVNLEQGYTSEYQKPPSKGGYYIEMPQFNQILYETQAAIKDVQSAAVLAVNNKLPDDDGAVTLTKADIGLGNLEDGGYIPESAIGKASGVAGLSPDLELTNTLVTNADGVYLKHTGSNLIWQDAQKNDIAKISYKQSIGGGDQLNLGTGYCLWSSNILDAATGSKQVLLDVRCSVPSYDGLVVYNERSADAPAQDDWQSSSMSICRIVDKTLIARMEFGRGNIISHGSMEIKGVLDMGDNTLICSVHKSNQTSNLLLDTAMQSTGVYLQHEYEGRVVFGKDKHIFYNNDGSSYHSGNVGIGAAIDPAYSLNISGDLNITGSAKIHGNVGVSRDWVYGYNLAVNNALLIAGKHLRFGEVDEPTKLLKVAHGAIDCYYDEVSGGRFDVVLGNGSGALSRTLVVNKYGLYINSEPDSAYALKVGGNAHFSGVIQCQGLTTLVINPGQGLPPAENYPVGTIVVVQTGPNHSYLMVSVGTIWRSVRVDNL